MNDSPLTNPWTAVILAAGMGKRMGGSTPKTLHNIAHRPMIAHVANAAEAAGASRIILVVAANHAEASLKALDCHNTADIHGFIERDPSAYKQTLSPPLTSATAGAKVGWVTQNPPRGTGDAARLAWHKLKSANREASTQPIVILNGDSALISPNAISSLIRHTHDVSGANNIALLTFNAPDPSGYGRAIIDRDDICTAIIEDRDLPVSMQSCSTCYAGAMAVPGSAANLLDDLTCNNAQGEYYLTELITIAQRNGINCRAVQCTATEALGANNPAELAQVEAAFQRNARSIMLNSGVRMIAPETVWLAADTKIEPDVEIEPNVVFGAGVCVRSGARIKAFSHLEGCEIGPGAQIGPFARLRTGTILGRNSKIGNFVELKQTNVGQGSKINHLSYIGDSVIGSDCNIGAGTITCNYDGVNKHQTIVHDNAFVGSNSALVAPVEIGHHAYVGSGSVITKSVTAKSLAISRTRQTEIPGWIDRKRAQTNPAEPVERTEKKRKSQT